MDESGEGLDADSVSPNTVMEVLVMGTGLMRQGRPLWMS